MKMTSSSLTAVSPKFPSLALAVLAAIAVPLYPQFASSASTNWIGGTSTVWTLAGNWSNGVPANSTADTAVFGSTYAFQPSAPANRSIGSILITGGNTNPLTITTTTGVGRLTVGSGVIMQAGSAAVTIGNTNTQGIRLAASQTLQNDSSSLLTLGSVGNAIGAHALTLAGSGSGGITINGLADGTSGGSNSLIVNMTGTGVATLTSANTFSGDTTISAGVLNLTNSQALATSALNTTNSVTGDATNGLQTTVTALTVGGLTGNKDLASVFTTTSGGYSAVTALTLNPLTGSPSYSGSIGNGAAGMSLTKTGAGTQVLTGTNTYTGATTISTGTLQLGDGTTGNDGTIAGTSGVTNNATLAFNRFGTVTSGYAISGSGAVTMTGTGTQILTGVNTYLGATTVNGGALIIGVGGVGSITSAVTVNTGTFGGSGSSNAAVTIGNGTGGSDSFLAPGNSPGTFTTTGALSLLSDATYLFELNSTTGAADKVVANGVTIDSAALFSFNDLGNGSGVTNGMQFTVIDNTGGNALTAFANLADGGTVTSNGVTYTASYTGGTGNDLVLTAAVPEPGTWAMLLLGTVSLFVFRRRRLV